MPCWIRYADTYKVNRYVVNPGDGCFDNYEDATREALRQIDLGAECATVDQTYGHWRRTRWVRTVDGFEGTQETL